MSTSPAEPAARVKSQPQRVFDGVYQRIQAGALKPGDRVPSEPELMREFGVSRTVVREAMSRLQASGLVETRQGVGTFVLAPTAGEPLMHAGARTMKVRQKLAMLELRISLESEAASLAAARRDEAHLAGMRAALDAFDQHRREGAATTEDDFRFHVQIAAATGNEYFEEVLRSLGSATIPRAAPPATPAATLASSSSLAAPSTRGPAGSEAPRGATAGGGATSAGADISAGFGEVQPALEPGKLVTQGEHEAIFEAIRRGDAPAARAAMFMHLSNSRERFRKTLA